MQKVLSIAMSILVFCQSVSFSISDLMQLNQLIKHAQFHNEKYGDGVFDFFSKHYGALKTTHNNNHKEEKNQHDKLPFQNSSVVQAVYGYSPFWEYAYGCPSVLESIPYRSTHFYFLLPYNYLFKTGVFQPPRCA